MIDIIPNNYWWAQTITAMRFGDDDKDMYELHGEEAFTDSGTSCIIVPSRYFEWFYDRLRYDFGMSYTSINMQSIYLNDCNTISDLPTLWFLFGGHWFQANPDDYIIEWGDRCFVCLTKGDDKWVLGDAFMRGYYIVHDLDTL